MCGNCTRLQLECVYQSPRRKRRQPGPEPEVSGTRPSKSGNQSNNPSDLPAFQQSAYASATPPRSGCLGHFPRSVPQNQTLRDFALSDAFGGTGLQGTGWDELLQDQSASLTGPFGYGMPDFGAPWAGQMCSFPAIPGMSPDGDAIQSVDVSQENTQSSPEIWMLPGSGAVDRNIGRRDNQREQYDPALQFSRVSPEHGGNDHSRGPLLGSLSEAENRGRSSRQENQGPRGAAFFHDTETVKLVSLFQKVTQPPAAILIGGVRKWRHLQQYLIELASKSPPVLDALLCFVELLAIEETTRWPGRSRDICADRILERHRSARCQIEDLVSNQPEMSHLQREQALATLFLLGWFEVVRDQNGADSLFPRHLAEAIITNKSDWNRHSRQLLSWFNTLDSKASHLSGGSLLPAEILEIVSQHPNQIVGSNVEDVDESDDATEADKLRHIESPMSDAMSKIGPSHGSFPSASLTGGHIKQVVLRAVLQPALEWYLASQSYCRRIRSHDKHHRKRFTPGDEFEVIVACKQLEKDLWEFWGHRPTIISLNVEDLAKATTLEMAVRIGEIFSIYLASFWILFVYLHRVSWWNLPLSPTANAALMEVWRNMQRAYGEVISNGQKKVVHPALLWPLFLFGSECTSEQQRAWAIEQLEALGESKPIVTSEDQDGEDLPPFRMGSGATRNAKRAALLLRELIKKQDEQKTRVDDRDLSMGLFGCYFSIV